MILSQSLGWKFTCIPAPLVVLGFGANPETAYSLDRKALAELSNEDIVVSLCGGNLPSFAFF
jgi:hypothetical protein